jgi:hypothetical protein
MKKEDSILSDRLKKIMFRIDDASFTQGIIRRHLTEQKKIDYKPFPGFGLLITGISAVIVSMGLILSIKTKTELIKGFAMTDEYGLVMLVVSLIFLVSVWMDSFIITQNHTRANI